MPSTSDHAPPYLAAHARKGEVIVVHTSDIRQHPLVGRFVGRAKALAEAGKLVRPDQDGKLGPY
jgi:hypothetical protein